MTPNIITKTGFLIPLLFALITGIKSQSLVQARSDFFRIAENPSEQSAYSNVPMDQQNLNPASKAYYGAITAMMANTVYNPFTRFSYFSRGKQMIETAVIEDRMNWEIRLVRFMVQVKCPSFLNYNNIIEDKTLIISDILNNCKLNKDLKELAVNFLVSSGKLSAREMKLLTGY